MRRLTLLALAALLGAAPAVHAQKDQKVPKRPKLTAGADTNDWQVYQQTGFALLRTRPDKAADAFWWAERLNPARAEPLYGLWVARHLQNPNRLLEYWKGADYVVNSGEVQRLDSLNYQAIIRNPLFHRGAQRLLLSAVYDAEMGQGNWEWAGNPENTAWLAYTEGRMPDALAQWAAVLKSDPKRYYLHEQRAYAFAAMGQNDSAITEMSQLIDELARRDRRRLRYFYESRGIYQYAIGIMATRMRDYDAAREAFGKALSEDLSLYMAHGGLGAVALQQGDTATALTEYDQAVQINGRDPVLLHDYGIVLLMANRNEDAEKMLGRAAALDPWFATAHYYHAIALERLAKKPEAVAEYATFVARAPRSMGGQVKQASDHIVALGGSAGAPAQP